MAFGVVAIVGSPNVGKSTVFNRIVGERKAIVDDQPGVTRDRLYARASWLTREFRVIDTGGIELANRPFQEEIRMQAEIAMEEADVIIFVCDGKLGVTGDDRMVAKMLYKCHKPIVLAVNKVDNIVEANEAQEFYSLGLGEPIPTSGAHGIGIADVLDKVIKLLPEKEDRVYENAISFAVIGRPNVGKSTLVNALLSKQRVISSPIEGTTRDSIDVEFEHNGTNYVAIDTAGLKKRGKIFEAIDKYSALRALAAIDRAEVALFLIDGFEGIKEQDKHVVGYAHDAHKAIVFIVNKWDIVVKDEKTADQLKKDIRREFKFLDYVNIIFISAKEKKNIESIYKEIDIAYASYNKRVITSTLNEIISDAQIMNQTPDFNGGRLKIYFAEQIGVRPPTFVLFVNNPEFAHFSYLRYIENRLRETFGFEGSPIKLVLRERK